MTHPAVLEVLGNPYLCMAIAKQHPTAYARLMLVSRRFHDWLNGKEEIVVYDCASREFRKKVTDKKAFKQKYKESWVVKKVDGHVELTFFSHSRRTHSIGDQPSYVSTNYYGCLTRSWSDNGRLHRDNGPATITSWSSMNIDIVWRKNALTYRNDGPARIFMRGSNRDEEWRDDRGHWKTVAFSRVGNEWIPTAVWIKTGGVTRYLVSITSEFLLEAGEAHVEHDFD